MIKQTSLYELYIKIVHEQANTCENNLVFIFHAAGYLS